MTLTPTIKQQVMELRAKNGLSTAEADLIADLAKVRVSEDPYPRMRKAGNSPLFVMGKSITANGMKCPITGELDTTERPVAKPSTRGARKSSEVTSEADSKEKFYRVLHNRGYAIRVSKDLITGEVREEIPANLAEMNFKFQTPGSNIEGVYISQVSPQIQVTMNLDKFLELARLTK